MIMQNRKKRTPGKTVQTSEEVLREIVQRAIVDAFRSTELEPQGLDTFKSKEPKSKWPDKELLTRKEAADLLGVKENTLSVWTVRGTGPPSTKIGSCVRYRRSELEKYIENNTMPR
jgi:excisionase family DNA binding protein